MTNLPKIYLDSNILIYSFCNFPDAEKHKRISIALIEKLLETSRICISDLSLSEFAFVMNKLKEEPEKIKSGIKYFKQFIQHSIYSYSDRYEELINKTGLYKSSFDCQYVVFAETIKCSELITFDKGFEIFKPFSTLKISVLKTD